MCDIFGGGDDQQSVTKNKLPKWFEGQAQSNLTSANLLSLRPFPNYSAPRIAPFTADQLAAFSGVRGAQGLWKPAFDTALPTMEGFAGERFIDNGNPEAYMSPYIKGALDPAAQEINRQAGINRAQLGREAASDSAFGGGRAGVAEGALDRSTIDAIGNLYGTGYQNAYQAGAGQYNADRAARMQAALSAAGLGAQQSGLAYQDAAALRDIGGQQQYQGQQNLDLAYNDFLREFGYPIEMLNLRTSTLAGTPYSSKQITTGPSGNTGAATLGGLGALAGGLGMLGSSTNIYPWLGSFF